MLGLQWPTASTTFVQSDGAFTGRCSRAGGAHVLRIASAPGTPVPKASPTPEWGLHLVDANIAQGDLVRVLRKQIRAFVASSRSGVTIQSAVLESSSADLTSVAPCTRSLKSAGSGRRLCAAGPGRRVSRCAGRSTGIGGITASGGRSPVATSLSRSCGRA